MCCVYTLIMNLLHCHILRVFVKHVIVCIWHEKRKGNLLTYLFHLVVYHTLPYLIKKIPNILKSNLSMCL